jgi:hypothetical protein
MHMYVHVHLYVYVYVCICMYVCMYERMYRSKVILLTEVTLYVLKCICV